MKRRKLLLFGASIPAAVLTRNVVEPIEPETKYHFFFSNISLKGWSYIPHTKKEMMESIYQAISLKRDELISFGLLVSTDLNKEFSSQEKVEYRHMLGDDIDWYIDDVISKCKNCHKKVA